MLWFYLSGIKLVMAKNVLFQWTSKYSSSTNTPEAYIHLKRKYSISQKTKEDVDGAASQYTTHPPVIILWYSTSQKALVHQHVTQQSTERPRSLEMENPFAHKKAMPRLDRFMGLDRLKQQNLQVCNFPPWKLKQRGPKTFQHMSGRNKWNRRNNVEGHSQRLLSLYRK